IRARAARHGRARRGAWGPPQRRSARERRVACPRRASPRRRRSPVTATRVVLAEDQPMVRAGFRALLDARSDIEVVGEAATGAEALEQVRALRPDVVVMDIRMPEMD